MRGMIFMGVLATAIAAAASPAVADTYYAAPDGDGAFPCAKPDPCPIQAAVDEVSNPDDRARVLPGRYELADTIDLPSSGAVRGVRGRPARIITGGDPAMSVTIGSPTVSDLVLKSQNQALLAGFSTAVFERLRAFGANGTVGTCTLPVAPGVLRDSLCVNEGLGPAITHGVGAGGTYSEDLDLVNVTAVARSESSANANGLAGTYSTGNPAAVIDVELVAKNTILRGGGATADVEGQAAGPGTETLVMNLVRSNFGTTAPGDNTFITGPGVGNNQTAEPRFVDPADGNYHQRRSSPTINAGRGDPLLGAFDFEGDRRVLDRKPDIGADEFRD